MVMADGDMEQELKWTELLKKNHTPVLLIVNKCDRIQDLDSLVNQAERTFLQKPIAVSAKENTGIDEIRAELIRETAGRL